MTRRKALLVAMSIAVVAILAVGGSLAYFTATQAKSNVYTVGNVKIDLTEPGWESQGKEDAKEVYPGEPLAKDPTVANTGANPCFVRIKVDGLDNFVPATIPSGKTKEDYMIKFRTNYTDGVLGVDWEDGGDGYFYYKHVLAVGTTTATPLFQQIAMPWTLTNGNATTNYYVNVTAQAVQAQGAKPAFADVQTMTVAEIKTWFGTCGL